MHEVWTIARLSFLEGVRHRLHHGILIFVILMLLAASALASVTMGRTQMLLLDLGLGLLALVLNLVAIVFTIQSVQQEKDNRTLYLILTRLDARAPYIWGKLLGVGMLLLAQAAAMGLALFALARFFGPFFAASFWQAVFTSFLEAWVVAAVALVFAQASSFFLALVLTLGVDVAGRFVSVIAHLAERSDVWLVKGFAHLALIALPHLEAINLRDAAGYVPAYAWSLCAEAAGYALGAIMAWTMLAAWIFARRNLA
ncbi:MAG: hypothetical protein D6771_02650 [Zetaproteobacteria bacterium]|nr:MAG: hypothetical protein D6771_02650 [Zetaproteobacteria bacterium]